MQNLKFSSVGKEPERKRIICPFCNRKESVYCCHCCIALGHEAPKVDLPVELDIYRNDNESPRESTTVYAKLVAPSKTTILNWDPLNEDNYKELRQRYKEPERIVLLYPTHDSITLAQVDLSQVDKIVVIDGTWHQAKNMAKVFSKCGFIHVNIQKQETMFWRHQNITSNYLATIEAIYYLYKEWFECVKQPNQQYDGQYDDLLYYFKLKYDLIQKVYHGNQKQFCWKHAKSKTYIKSQ